MVPLLDEMLLLQQQEGRVWTPSKMIAFLGSKIEDTSSIYYWAWKNNIPVYCPGITDGSYFSINNSKGNDHTRRWNSKTSYM